MERLQKVIAQSGITSRRKAEQLIVEGRVKVNGVVVNKLGTTVTNKDKIMVDDQPIKRESKVYLVMNKPANYICSVSDDRDRPVITSLITDVKERIYPVGRLDFDTTGVIILTNDGDFANRITHPSNQIDKTYRVSVKGRVSEDKLDLLRRGITVDGEEIQGALVDISKYNNENNKTIIHLTIHEGKNHQVKRMFEAIGYEVIKLHRVSVGHITDKGLKVGKYRDLTSEEIQGFYL